MRGKYGVRLMENTPSLYRIEYERGPSLIKVQHERNPRIADLISEHARMLAEMKAERESRPLLAREPTRGLSRSFYSWL